jgi:hypothetical protein
MFNRNEINSLRAPDQQRFAWWELEENYPHGGMWQIPLARDRQVFIIRTRELMANPPLFKAAMQRAVKEWPRSCANALSTPGLNHQAWIGHAGCFLATASPEETTRLGWHELDEGEQYAANLAAAEVIQEWRDAQRRTGLQQPLLGDFDA